MTLAVVFFTSKYRPFIYPL